MTATLAGALTLSLAFSFAASMIITIICQPALAARFVDLSGYWAEKYINKLSDRGVIPYAGDGKFNPTQPITRGDLAQWMVLTLGIEKQPVSKEASFPDVKPGDQYYNAVEIIRQNNYISGYKDGFRPKQFIQRGEMITIVSKALNAKPLNDDTVDRELSVFVDRSQIPQSARDGVAIASREGILVSEYADKVNATAMATRGEAAAVLCALRDYLDKRNVTDATAAAEQQLKNGGMNQGQGTANGGSFSGAPFQGQVQRQDIAFGQPPGGMPVGPNGMGPNGMAPSGFPPQGIPGGGWSPPMFPMQGQPGAFFPGQTPMFSGMVSTVAAGTTINASLKNSLNSGASQPGEAVEAIVSVPISTNGQEVVPKGSRLIGQVTDVVSAKRFKFGANGKIDVKFTHLVTPDGRRFPLEASIDSNRVRLTGGTGLGRVGKGALTTAVGAGGGAALGTALGAIVGATADGSVGKATGMGAAFGTALGGGVGLVGAGVRKGSEVQLPAGLALPIRVDQTFQVTANAPAYIPGQFMQGAPYGMPMTGMPPMGGMSGMPPMGGMPMGGSPMGAMPQGMPMQQGQFVQQQFSQSQMQPGFQQPMQPPMQPMQPPVQNPPQQNGGYGQPFGAPFQQAVPQPGY